MSDNWILDTCNKDSINITEPSSIHESREVRVK